MKKNLKNNYKFGWRPQKPDHRDHKFTLTVPVTVQSVYLSDKYKVGLPYDQGQLGSCTANALAFAAQFDLMNKNLQGKAVSPYIPSRLFIYYYERVLENTIAYDAGAEIRDGIKVLNTYGAPSEDLWPYDITQFTVAPPVAAINEGKGLTAFAYQTIASPTTALIVAALQQGLPVVFGITVYESFVSDIVASTGIVPYPGPSETIAGGHAMVIVGYHEVDDSFIVRNSWGTEWGQAGYCRVPASYITNANLTSDFWVIYTLSGN